MKEITTIGLDIAKHFFQVYGVDADGECVLNRKLKRKDVLEFFMHQSTCLVGLECCSSSHAWAEELQAIGHRVKQMPAGQVKAFVYRQKNDAADAAAICVAARQPHVSEVPVKGKEQRGLQALLTTRDRLVGQLTQSTNALHALFFEELHPHQTRNLGVTAMLKAVEDGCAGLTELGAFSAKATAAIIVMLQKSIKAIDARLAQEHYQNAMSRLLATIPGVGILSASTILAHVVKAERFKNGRSFAAWVGLVPRQHSSGGKERLGSITHQGDRTLRRLLYLGAISVIRRCQGKDTVLAQWVTRMLARKPAKVVAIALANKLARIIWVVLTRGVAYNGA